MKTKINNSEKKQLVFNLIINSIIRQGVNEHLLNPKYFDMMTIEQLIDDYLLINTPAFN